MEGVVYSVVRYRQPWNLICGNKSKGNVYVAGDAFHPMIPYIGPGGCASMEDCVVLKSYCPKKKNKKADEDHREDYKRIELGLTKYSNEKRLRGLEFVTMAYIVGFVEYSTGVIMNFLRDKFFGQIFD